LAPGAAPRLLVRFLHPHMLDRIWPNDLDHMFINIYTAAIGRRLSLIAFALVFCVGAILTTVAGPGDKGLNEIYIGGLHQEALNVFPTSQTLDAAQVA
jgi:hypothetical protein